MCVADRLRPRRHHLLRPRRHPHHHPLHLKKENINMQLPYMQTVRIKSPYFARSSSIGISLSPFNFANSSCASCAAKKLHFKLRENANNTESSRGARSSTLSIVPSSSSTSRSVYSVSSAVPSKLALRCLLSEQKRRQDESTGFLLLYNLPHIASNGRTPFGVHL